jgi:hypothetical protein
MYARPDELELELYTLLRTWDFKVNPYSNFVLRTLLQMCNVPYIDYINRRTGKHIIYKAS